VARRDKRAGRRGTADNLGGDGVSLGDGACDGACTRREGVAWRLAKNHGALDRAPTGRQNQRFFDAGGAVPFSGVDGKKSGTPSNSESSGGTADSGRNPEGRRLQH